MSSKISQDIEKKVVYLYTHPSKDGSWIGVDTISKLVSVSRTTVANILFRNGVKQRTPKEAHSNGKRCKPITNVPTGKPGLCKCGCGNPVTWNQRKNRWNLYCGGHYRKNLPYKSKIWLSLEYSIRHRTIQDIANQFGVNRSTVKRFLSMFGIKIRTTSESLLANGSMRGKRNPSWKGGVAVWKYSPDWKRIAHDIRKRDNYTCQICRVQFPKSSKILHVHHRDGNKLNNSPDNLQTVCATCHPRGKRKEGWNPPS